MRQKTSVAQLDSAEARAEARAEAFAERAASWLEDKCGDSKSGRKHKKHKPTGFWAPMPRDEKPPLTVGNVIHFVIAVFFLWPIFLVIAAIWSLGDAVNFVRHTIEACISSTFWFGRLLREWTASMYLHRNSPAMLRLKGQRRAFGHEAAKDWGDAAKALVGVGRAWSKTFGLGGLFSSLEKRIEKSNVDWRRYVATAAFDQSQAPAEFPEQYVVIDELQPGGSSARLYVVRKAEDGDKGTLYVLKYFNLRAGGNLESVVRESQAAQLAQKLGLIIESKLGDSAFWYVMPYYHGETLTGGVMRNIKQARNDGSLPDHYRISLGYVHQLLQIIARYHESGVFHKDIKPDNLIINGEKIYLVDIGLMTPLSSMAQLTTHGTEYFRDPEMVKLALEGREVREVDAAKFDVYSIGAVLFFALSGEFPTSGALSRLPTEVPMVTQWVVNRAMTGMHQRYSDARAMLTDIDYLCWAAANGQLGTVKPADLPSFKGMPVPPHLAAPADTQRLAAAPGGYGAWYSAPAYARPDKGLTIGKAFAILFLVAGLAAIGVITVAALKDLKQQQLAQQVPSKDESLAQRLPEDRAELAPLFAAYDRALDRGVRVETNTQHSVLPRVELAPAIVSGVETLAREWDGALKLDMRKHADGRAEAGAAMPEAQLLFISIDGDEADQALAQGIEVELELEVARRRLAVHDLTTAEVAALRALLSGITDKVALHRELAARFAEWGRRPVYVALFSIEHSSDGQAEMHLRVIHPGREHRAVVPFGEPSQD